ncbi:MAG: NADH-quinone oxidoreductase subunit C [Actinomycetota bacterium]|nr:NADH-quinone oxidoreductase subunit C [Actinomycetota bacterium]
MTSGPPPEPAGAGRSARVLPASELVASARELLGRGQRLALVACHDDGDSLRAVYLFLGSRPERRDELHVLLDPARPEVPTTAGLCFPGGRFEREMHDLFGVVPVGHPLPRRLVRHSSWPAGWYPMRRGAGDPPPFAARSDPYPFLEVEGTGVYEIPVGPIHAGIIEPGHFRFSVVGETILKLKARLWFLHRGMERCFEGRRVADGVVLAERISGDTSAAHGLAYARAVEDALGWDVGPDVRRLRALVLELERITNHVADLGALANDAGLSVVNGHALALRERMLRMAERVTGHRLWRGAIHPGGVRLASLPDPRELAEVARGADEVARNALGNTTVRDRFEGTAVLRADDASALGCLGVVARASGIRVDARADHPACDLAVDPVVRDGGDVLARFLVRRDEVAASVGLVAVLSSEAGARLSLAHPAPREARPTSSGIGIVEGSRGTIVHRVEIDGELLARVKVVDPSWFNWPALPVALADTIVPDFPLANKSFGLSYAGNDL